jgi:hypothetical protein
MSIEAIAAQAAGAAGGAGAVPVTDLGAAGSADPAAAGRFDAAMERAGGTPTADLPPAVQGMFRALDSINVQASNVSNYARTAEASGGQLTPGEMVQLTMQCQQFMFECQLTSNIANRSSDGVQQLFKQQG